MQQPEPFFAPQRAATARPQEPLAPLYILAAVLLPCALAYCLTTGSELQVTAVVLSAATAVVLAGISMTRRVEARAVADDPPIVEAAERSPVPLRGFWGLVLFLGLLYVRPEESVPALAGTHLTLAVSLVTLVAAVLDIAVNRKEWVRTPWLTMLAGFCVWGVVSTIGRGNTLDAVQVFAKLLALGVLIVQLVRTREQYGAVVTAILAFSTFLALYSAYLYMAGHTVYDTAVRSEATGIFSDPNDLAATFVASLALALGGVRDSTGWRRAACAVVAAILLGAIILTHSRGGMLGLLAVSGGFVVLTGKRKPIAIGLAVLIGLALLVAVPGRMRAFDSSEASANSRFWFWSNGVDQLTHNPLFGVGYGQFPSVNGGMVAHNSFVQCFAELGFPGYCFWMGCICLGLRRRETAGASPYALTMRGATIPARLALMGYLVSAFWITRTYNPVLFVVLALPLTADLVARGMEAARPPRPKLHWGYLCAISCGSILVIKIIAEHLR